MQAIDWIMNYPFVRHALITGVSVGTVCSLLSVVVVLKRMAFIGEGVSHAGFGGMGTALLLGLGGVSQSMAVLVFCVATGVFIGVLSRRKEIEPDSAIGILLVAAMAWGVLMTDVWRNVREAPWYVAHFGPPGPPINFESALFGSLLSVGPEDMYMAIIGSLLVLLICAAFFKEIVFFAFDERVSRVFGVPATFIYYLLLVLLSVVIVLTIRLAGFVLVSALLVVPGATALLLSRRLGWVLFISWLVGMAGVLGGLFVSLEIPNVSSGPCIVGILCLVFAAVYGGRAASRRREARAGAQGMG